MHPDVRSPNATTCAICGMALVPIPPPVVGEYKMDVSLTRDVLRLIIREPAGLQPVTQLLTVHERPLHLFIVGRDLTYFAHEHPERGDDGAFVLRHRLPPGEYMLLADFLPQGGTAQMLQRAIVTPAYRGRLFRQPSIDVDMSEKISGDTGVRLEVESLAPRRASRVRVVLRDLSSDKAVDDLEPYLGAAGHMLIVNTDLTDARHTHPQEQNLSGPVIAFAPLFPAPGKYKLWVQFQRKGNVHTVAFAVEVPTDTLDGAKR